MKYNGNVKKEILEPKMFIGVDPGKNGGIAIINNDGDCVSYRCPKTVNDMAMSLMSLMPNNVAFKNIIAHIEHVHAMPGNGVVSMFSFGQNLGQWEGIFACLEIDVIYTGPRTWMSHYDCKPNMDKKERKRYLRGIAEKLFPNIKMTFNISDALLIANYAKEIYYKQK